MKKSFLMLFIALNLGFAFSSSSTKPIVSVSIPPQEYFVKQIAGDTLQINIIIPAGTDEHNLDFQPATMQKLEKSDIYFTIGLEIERGFADKFKSNFKKLQIIDTGAGLRTLFAIHEHHADSDKKDPHIWLDPILVKSQAEIIAQTLIATYPHNKALYEKNLATFKAELDVIHEQIVTLLADKKGKKFIVYHPSWGYFATRYDLVQIPVEFEGKEPKPRDLQKLVDQAKKEQITTIFVQKGFPQNTAKSLAKELNANIVEIDHLSADWHNELLKSAENLGR